jgi:DNA polymerase III epsilon subunit-like protein
MKAVIFDTETNGKPLNWNAKMTHLKNWPRVTQLAFSLVDIPSGQRLTEYQSLIKPDGWLIPKEQFFIDNNMSTERCQSEGKPIAEVFGHFVESVNVADFLVAHNIAFDYNVLGAEMIRSGIRAKKLTRICTMLASCKYCQLPRNKWPKLIELHQKLFGNDFEGAHDAMFDVNATEKCFIELVKLKIITL